jgi:glycosyltransferase domain-containing protein
VKFAEFPDVDPTEKWRQGIHMVKTPFCALCADDDLVILDGLRRCLNTLRTNLAASVVQGYSFTFLPQLNGDIELNNIVYFNPSIEEKSAVGRIAKLFEQYQAPTYGAFRTPVLQRIYDASRPLERDLSRELLWSALTAVEGAIIRLPCFSYGRNMGPSGAYECWHPLEWFCKDPDSLFAEYLRYRELVAAAVLERADNDQTPQQVCDMLDCIHLRYLAKHAPDSVLEFIVQQQVAGADFASYWPSHEIQLPLYHSSGVRPSKMGETLSPTNIRRKDRSYKLFPSFFAPLGVEAPRVDEVVQLLATLDSYPAIPDATSP